MQSKGDVYNAELCRLKTEVRENGNLFSYISSFSMDYGFLFQKINFFISIIDVLFVSSTGGDMCTFSKSSIDIEPALVVIIIKVSLVSPEMKEVESARRCGVMMP